MATPKIAADWERRRRLAMASGSVDGAGSTVSDVTDRSREDRIGRGSEPPFGISWLLRSLGPRSGLFFRYAQHSPAEKARPHRRPRARGEHPLPLDGAYAHTQAPRRGREGEQAEIESAHRDLVRWIDKAAAQGAHPQEHRRPPQGAGREARLRRRELAAPSTRPSTSARVSSSSSGSRLPPLIATSRSASRTSRAPRALRDPSARPAAYAFRTGNSLRRLSRFVASAGRMPSAANTLHAATSATWSRERPRETARRPAPAEQALGARRERPATSRSTPGVGQRPRLHGPARRDHLLDVLGRDLLAFGPERELLHLEPKLVRVLADEVEEQAARIGLSLRAELARTARRPTPRASSSPPRRRARRLPSRKPCRAASPSSPPPRRARAPCPARAPRGSRRPPQRLPPSSRRPCGRRGSGARRPRSRARADRTRRRDRARCTMRRPRRLLSLRRRSAPSPRRRSAPGGARPPAGSSAGRLR